MAASGGSWHKGKFRLGKKTKNKKAPSEQGIPELEKSLEEFEKSLEKFEKSLEDIEKSAQMLKKSHPKNNIVPFKRKKSK